MTSFNNSHGECIDAFVSTFDISYNKRRWASTFAISVEAMASLFSYGYGECHSLSPTFIFPWLSFVSKGYTFDELCSIYHIGSQHTLLDRLTTSENTLLRILDEVFMTYSYLCFI